MMTNHFLMAKPISPLQRPVAGSSVLKQIIEWIGDAAILPPPLTLNVVASRAGRGLQFHVEVAPSASPPQGVWSECIEVTGCLSPHAGPDVSPLAIESFRNWAVRHPTDPLAVRYQPLHAWVMAGRYDSRFRELVLRFVEIERQRIELEVLRAMDRLSSRLGLEVA